MAPMIEKLSTDPIWNCLTRAALELRWKEFIANATAVIYCDIDHMHNANTLYGHDGVDSRISKVIATHRSSDVVASRFLNGDEIVFIIRSGNAKQFSERMLKTLQDNDMSGTFAYTYLIGDDCRTTISPLDSKVQLSKNNNIRGIVID